MRCLIVDDSADFANAARRLLERDGTTVVDVASTCAEALRYCEELRPDVALVDVNLGSESGFDVTEQLHRSGSPTPPPVILISTHAEQDFAAMIADSPAIGFLSKMVLTDDAIRDLVDGRRMPAVGGPNGVARPINESSFGKTTSETTVGPSP